MFEGFGIVRYETEDCEKEREELAYREYHIKRRIGSSTTNANSYYFYDTNIQFNIGTSGSDYGAVEQAVHMPWGKGDLKAP